MSQADALTTGKDAQLDGVQSGAMHHAYLNLQYREADVPDTVHLLMGAAASYKWFRAHFTCFRYHQVQFSAGVRAPAKYSNNQYWAACIT